jgi:DNA-binding response OmpR family regulator
MPAISGIGAHVDAYTVSAKENVSAESVRTPATVRARRFMSTHNMRGPPRHLKVGPCAPDSVPLQCGEASAEGRFLLRILVVEDEKKVASFLEKGLREEGYAVDVAHDGADGLMKALVHDYDLVLLDVLMPGKSGLEVVRELRSRERTTPVLMLTARDAEQDVVLGLDAGADDYLTKPFGFDELLARVRALLRRGGAARPDRLMYEDVELDRVKHVALRGGERLDLTPKEFQLLEYLMLHAEGVVRRTELLEKVWDLHFDPMSNVVDVHVGNLRRKLDRPGRDDLVHTIRGVGYSLRKGVPE